MWNTGCNKIANSLHVSLNIVSGEDQSLAITVPSKKYIDFKSVIFPWCDNDWEIHHKAFRVVNLRNGRIIMYLFQDYRSNRICWVLASKTEPFRQKSHVLSGIKPKSPPLPPYSAIDIYILPTHVFGAASQSENTVFKEVFDDVMQVIEVGAKVAGEIAGALA